MITVKDKGSLVVTAKPSSLPGEVEITFTATSATAGTFTGITPSNDIWLNDYSTGANQTISIPVLSMTKVGESPWGLEFVDNIRSAQKYSFSNDDKLTIETANKLLTFRRL